MSNPIPKIFTTRLEQAMRRAAEWHHGQFRKGSKTPYIIHPFGVAMILDRFGFDEELIIAGLLHDVVEDTDATIDDIRREFGSRVAEIVGHCSETKLDTSGVKRPWIDRKRDHIEALAAAPIESRAVVLADKLQNLMSIACDLEAGRPVWSLFNAEREDVLTSYRTCLERIGHGEKLIGLVNEFKMALQDVERGGNGE